MSTGLLTKPLLGECTRDPWPFQDDAIGAIGSEYRKGVRATLAVVPTGGGKTTIFGLAARRAIERAGWRVLVLAHTDELCQQAINELDELGVQAELEKAGSRARSLYDPDCVVGSVQTLKGARLQEWPRDYFDLIVIDEGHHATAGTYRQIVAWFCKARVLLVTATPVRRDEVSLMTVAQTVAYQTDSFSLMTAPAPGPFLVRPIWLSKDFKINLKSLRKKKTDFCAEDMERRIAPHVVPLAHWWRDAAEGRPGVIFTPGVGSAQGIATALQSLGLRWDWISGDDPDRGEKVRRLHRGELDGVVNANLFLEGFNCKRLAAVGVFRLTKSLGLLNQMIGRGLRIDHATGKRDCLVLDPGLQARKMKSALGPAEILGAKWIDPETIELVNAEIRKAGKAGRPVDLLDAVERAREKIRARGPVVTIDATGHGQAPGARTRGVMQDPLAGLVPAGSNQGPQVHEFKMATPKQIALLKRFKIDGSRMSAEAAQTKIGQLMGRVRADRATERQVSTLAGSGIPIEEARGLSFKEASKRIDELRSA